MKSGVYDFLANIKHHPAGHTAYGDTSFSLDNVEGHPGISSLIYGWGHTEERAWKQAIRPNQQHYKNFWTQTQKKWLLEAGLPGASKIGFSR